MKSKIPARAFTLIELLTVIVIIGILAAILIPTVSSVRASARASQCRANLRSLGQTYLLFLDENKGKAPFENWSYPTWISNLMPVLVGDSVHKAHESKKRPYEILTCPSDNTALTDWYHTHYALNINMISFPTNDPGTAAGFYPLAVAQSPAQLILGMDYHSNQRVIRDTNIPEESAGTLAKTLRHKGKANAVYLDGHVASLSEFPTWGPTPPWRDR